MVAPRYRSISSEPVQREDTNFGQYGTDSQSVNCEEKRGRRNRLTKIKRVDGIKNCQ